MDRFHALSAVARGPIAFLALGVLIVLPIVSPAQAASTALSGIVKDSLGNALSGAEVLVLADQLSLAPIVSAQTNIEGRYQIPQLLPGVYRVAALKQGYLAYLGQIDTLLKSSMDFVLRPAPGASGNGAPLPDDMAWTLRIPERSLLRETEAKDLLRSEGKGGPPSPASARFYETIQGQVEHLVAFGGLPSGPELATVDVQGADTRMRVSSSLGERGSIQVQGRRESLDTADPTSPEGRTTGLDASSVFLDVAYDTGSDSSLAVKAYYGDRDLSLSSADPIPTRSVLREGQRAWGYDATWSKQIDASSRVAFQAGYLGTEIGDGVFAGEGSTAADTDFSHRVESGLAGASGLFESVSGGHRVRLGLRAERFDSPWSEAPAPSEPSGSSIPGWELSGWVVRMNAEDSWSVAGPISFVYGLGVDRSFDPSEPVFVAPHAGWVLSSEGLSLRMILSYRAVDGGRETPAGSPLGYELQMEAPLPYGLLVKGALKRTPEVYQGLVPVQGLSTLATAPSLLSILDSSAGVQHSRLALERQSGNTSTSVQWIAGTIEGVSAQLLPLQMPLRIDGQPSLRYWSGRIGVRVLPTGTDVAAEYVRVRDVSFAGSADTSAAPLEQYVELRIAQDLLRMPSWGGTCRLLVAARTTPGSDNGSQGEENESARTLAALNHRLSAGLSLAF